VKQTPLSQQNDDEKFEDREEQRQLTDDEPLSGAPATPIDIAGLPKPTQQVHGQTYEEESDGG
jgi:hypothetical protein